MEADPEITNAVPVPKAPEEQPKKTEKHAKALP